MPAYPELNSGLIDPLLIDISCGFDYTSCVFSFLDCSIKPYSLHMLSKICNRLERIGAGKIQVVYSGEAHPKDTEGKQIIEKIFSYIERLK